MISRVAGFIFRFFVGILTLIGGVFVILYAIVWDFIREKIFRKKPVENPCFNKVVVKEDVSDSEKEEKNSPNFEDISLN
ncbi:hypothetical protein [Aquimarina algicola]|uniref:Uncharacterized protein n=1 Tax=Aquimarina algicola TaxID=2589995 RepID=A0A504JAT1_9FLAO|nr:hypothetical protein [Aquimarina algicola]TPN83999.1 hypothetical protein FHK87_18730 [Aquimarina algicola]